MISTLYASSVIIHTLFWPKVIKLLACSAQLRRKFILLINVKMSTIVVILTFISRLNYYLMGFMPEFSTDFGCFSIHELLKFMLSCVEHEFSFIT